MRNKLKIIIPITLVVIIAAIAAGIFLFVGKDKNNIEVSELQFGLEWGTDRAEVEKKLNEAGCEKENVLKDESGLKNPPLFYKINDFAGIEEADVDENIIGLRNILVVATCLQMFASVHALAMRANYYFIPFVPVLMSKISAKSGVIAEKNTVKLINGALILFYIVYFFYIAYTGEDTLEIFPYETYWSELS